MKNETAEYEWEVLPWSLDDKEESYAIYVDRGESRHASLPPSKPCITISNQNDCAEVFSFSNVADLDSFLGRLNAAREWLMENATPSRAER